MKPRILVSFVMAVAACTPLHDDQPDSGAPDSVAAGMPDGSADAGVDADSSATTSEAGASCAPLDRVASDIYVDVNATAVEAGTSACPYHSITAGIEAAQRSTAAARTIHVAAGTYDANHGETFPLELRAGTSLVGAGAATTIIQGVGKVVAPLSPHDSWQDLNATFALGDPVSATALRAVTILPVEKNDGLEIIGVLCDTGNVVFPQPTLPAPNSEISDLVVGQGFGSGVKLVGAAYGCNLRIVRSTFKGSTTKTWSTGVFVAGAGCGGFGHVGTPPDPVALAIGDGTAAGGNTFSGFRGDPSDAVSVQGCISSFSMTNNVITESDVGLFFEALPDANEPVPTVTVTGNTFSAINGRTIHDWVRETELVGAVFIEAPSANVRDFSDNLFTRVIASAGAPPVAALTIGAISAEAELPAMFHARRNQFVGNDIGLLIEGRTNTLTSASVLDFGIGGDGYNEFRCNARSASSSGGDVVIDMVGDSTASIQLSGNLWDHTSPTTTSSTTPSDGTDVAFLQTPKPAVDLSAPRLSTLACPAGHAP